MTGITHHLSDDILSRYAAGRLPHPFAVVVAAHLALCDDCRALVEAGDMLGGALVDGIGGTDLSPGAEARLMQALDDAPPPAPEIRASGIFPAPVMQAILPWSRFIECSPLAPRTRVSAAPRCR